jgi:DNA repair photolyase
MPSQGGPRGRGAAENPASRFDRLRVVPDPDDVSEPRTVETHYYHDETRRLISDNESPDIPFEASINPYRGCEHGCVYCYARPYHEYLGLSAGLDFETRIFVKDDAPGILRRELLRKSWTPKALALSGVTDPYQPVERTLGLTRRCLEVLAEFRNPVGLITKNPLVLRDADVLRELARHRAVSVALSVTTLDESLRRTMEPRTATADARLDAIARLNEQGIPAGVMMAPIVPGLTDHEVPELLRRAGEAGARFAGYIMLRLPHGVGPLFEAWLDRHYPERKAKVLARVRDVRGGGLNDGRFGPRMKGTGPFAIFIRDAFQLARARAGIPASGPTLSVEAFRRPTGQRGLFDDVEA